MEEDGETEDESEAEDDLEFGLEENPKGGQGDTPAEPEISVPVEEISKKTKAVYCLTKNGKKGVFFGSTVFAKDRATYRRAGLSKARERVQTGVAYICSKYKSKNCLARIHVDMEAQYIY